MKRDSYCVVCALLAAFVLVGCSRKSEEEQVQETAKKLEEAGQSFSEAMQEGGGDFGEAMKKMQEAMKASGGVEPVNFRKLKELLPEKFANYRRVSIRGEKSGMFGMKVSFAEAEYENDEGGRIEIKITDTGTMRGFAAMGASYAWSMAEIDRESDEGYERTVEFEGYRAFEKMNYSSKQAQLSVIVGSRFIVDANGWNTKMDHIREGVKATNLDELEAKKDEGTEQ